MKRIPTENNPLLTNMKKKEYKDGQGGRGLRKMIIINNNIVWRSLTYNELMPNQLVEFCTKEKLLRKIKNKETGEVLLQANDYPTIQEFRVKHKIPKSRWQYWVKEYPELKEAVELVKDHQESALIKNGLSGRWNAQVTKSVGMAEHEWSEKKETITKQETLTDEQKRKMFEEYMMSLKQDGMVIDGEVLDDNDTDANLGDTTGEDKE